MSVRGNGNEGVERLRRRSGPAAAPARVDASRRPARDRRLHARHRAAGGLRRLAAISAGAATLVVAIGLAAVPAASSPDVPELPELGMPYLVGGQSTAIWQYKPAFHSPYQGPNSLRGGTQDAVSDSYTVYLGLRPLPWVELYFAPEMIRGGGISDALGLAGFTSGEVIRNPTIGQDPYIARAFARLTIPLGETTEMRESSPLTIGSPAPAQRIELIAGILGTNDLFDTNRYANSARTQFMNWAFLTTLSYDYAADTRGYTRGVAFDWQSEQTALLAGIFQMPTVANGLELDSDVIHANGMQAEVDREIELLEGRPMILRGLFFRNLARMGSYAKAIDIGRETDETPVISATRKRGRQKYGFVVNLEQPLADDGNTGLFARLGWNDGANESFAYTEAERALSAGVQISGARWGRDDDRVGIALAAEELGNLHAGYLEHGGLGFILGDGRLNRRPEIVTEAYYLVQLTSWLGLTADYQLVDNPGYNRDRGPASVISLRGHIEGFVSAW
jgi:hypothetical protein